MPVPGQQIFPLKGLHLKRERDKRTKYFHWLGFFGNVYIATRNGNAQTSSSMETNVRSFSVSEMRVIPNTAIMPATLEGMVRRLVWKVLNLHHIGLEDAVVLTSQELTQYSAARVKDRGVIGISNIKPLFSSSSVPCCDL
jgi:hypothetical protein